MVTFTKVVPPLRQWASELPQGATVSNFRIGELQLVPVVDISFPEENEKEPWDLRGFAMRADEDSPPEGSTLIGTIKPSDGDGIGHQMMARHYRVVSLYEMPVTEAMVNRLVVDQKTTAASQIARAIDRISDAISQER